MQTLTRGTVTPATVLACAVALAGCGGATSSAEAPKPVRPALSLVADGLVRPTFAGAAPGDPEAVWVGEQPGRLVRVAAGRREVELDLRGRVKLGAEQGLLGIAFHPDFATNRRVFVHYSDRRGDTRVEEHRIARRHRTARSGGRVLLSVAQPHDNHNGGALVFGPDGRLYLGLGDGGGASDPDDRAQDLGSRLGKILAADVDARRRPRWRTVAYGLRNPWRMWFDPALGQLWVGDVGQEHEEEIDRFRPAAGEPPVNLGWPAFEGRRRLPGRRLDTTGRLVAPIATYPHPAGCSVTGGVIYGGAITALRDRYVFGDFCTGIVSSLRAAPGARAAAHRPEPLRVPLLTHIGTDGRGELLLVSGAGAVHRVVPSAR